MQDVDHLGHPRALLGIVHVGDHRQAHLLADLGEDRQRRIQAQAAGARQAGAVGLVERGLVDQADVEVARHLGQRVRRLQRVAPALHDARPGDDHERQVVADGEAIDGNVMRGRHRFILLGWLAVPVSPRGRDKLQHVAAALHGGNKCLNLPAVRDRLLIDLAPTRPKVRPVSNCTRRAAMKLSARNVFKGKVIDINAGPINSTVKVDIGSGNVRDVDDHRQRGQRPRHRRRRRGSCRHQVE